MVHTFSVKHIQTTFKYEQVLFDMHLRVEPFFDNSYKEKPKERFHWFEEYHWEKLGFALERVFAEKNWTRGTSNFNGSFYINPLVQVKYKVTNRSHETSGDQNEIIYKLECVVQNMEAHYLFRNWTATNSDVNYAPETSPVAYVSSKASNENNVNLQLSVGSPNGGLHIEPYSPEVKIRRKGRPPLSRAKKSENKTGDGTATNAGVNRSRKCNKDTTVGRPQLTRKTKQSNNLKRGREESSESHSTDSENKRSKSCPEAESPVSSGSPQLRSRAACASRVTLRGNIRKPRKKIMKATTVDEIFGAVDNEDATHRATTSSSAAIASEPTQPPQKSDANTPTSTKAMTMFTTTTMMKNENEGRAEQNRTTDALQEESLDRHRVPDQVELLFLRDLTPEDISNTFERHENQLNLVYLDLKNKTDDYDSYQGISHTLVMDLYDRDTEKYMIAILEKHYQLPPTHKSLKLMLNAMIPTWSLLIFMDKYKMTREDAIKQLKAQQLYEDFMKSKNSKGFFF